MARFNRYRYVERYGLDLHRLALLCGTSPSTLYRIDSGKQEPRPELGELLDLIRRLHKGRPGLTARLRVMLVSLGRLRTLAFVLRNGHLTGQMK